LILVDTPIWSLALRRRRRDLGQDEGRDVAEWERLVRAGRAALIGPIRQELLSGVRDARSWERLRVALRPFPDLPITTEDYERAAHFFNRCRARGITGRAIDLLICAVSFRFAAPVYTTDTDFRRYATALNLDLHSPRPRSARAGTAGRAL
jgi:predicted nucleic acid-binding protein